VLAFVWRFVMLAPDRWHFVSSQMDLSQITLAQCPVVVFCVDCPDLHAPACSPCAVNKFAQVRLPSKAGLG
jgi:hypothetical protein